MASKKDIMSSALVLLALVIAALVKYVFFR
jgi:hypothetical protein